MIYPSSGRVLISVRIVTRVLPRQECPKQTTNSTYPRTTSARSEEKVRAPSRWSLKHESFTQMLNLGEGILRAGDPNPHSHGPLRRFSPPRRMQLNGRISQFAESVTPLDHPHVLNITTPLLQHGQLWIVASTIPNNQGRDLGSVKSPGGWIGDG